ncbi:MAG: VanZ family protein [Myxococcota bacterium]|nr:VanZ family protein [Myxococcota bacterium]
MVPRRWLVVIAAAQAALVATIVFLADTDRLAPLLTAVHAVPLGDKLGHVVLMGTLALTVDLALHARTVTVARVPLRVGSMAVLAVVVLEELSQRWLPSRNFDLGDLAADVIGIAIGGALASLLLRRRASRAGAGAVPAA